MAEKLNNLNGYASIAGLKISLNRNENQHHQHYSSLVPRTKYSLYKFCYLGSTVTNQGAVEDNIQSIIQKASQVFAGMNEFWNPKGKEM